MQMKIKNVLKLIWGSFLIVSAHSALADLYKVTNVPVSAVRSSAMEAKEAALAEGQVVAFNRLMARLAPEHSAEVPRVTEESVLPYILGVSIENEKTTSTKYMGSIAVEFNPTAIKALLNAQKVTYLKTQAPSLLVIPEYKVNGQTFILDESNPLYSALKSKSDFAPFYRAVVPKGTSEEQALVYQGAAQMMPLLDVYGKEKLMFLRLQHVGEDMWKISSSFQPSSNMQGQALTKRFRFSSGDPKQASMQMADSVFKEMETRWRGERTSSLNQQNTLYLRISVDSLGEWLELEKEMKEWSFLEQVSLRGIYLPQVLVEISYKNDEDEVVRRLSNLGWYLEKDFSGNGGTLKRRKLYE